MKYTKFLEIGRGQLLNQLAFLARAAASEDMGRYFMQFIRVEADFSAVTTDGRRLHLVKRLHEKAQEEGLEPGAWEVKRINTKIGWLAKVSDEDAGKFPEYKQLFKDNPTFTGHWGGIRNRFFGVGLYELIFSFPKPTGFNTQYLQDIGIEEWIVRWWAPDCAVTFEAEDRRAMVMPINLELGKKLEGMGE